MSLVSGYDSDADSDDDVSTSTGKAGLAGLLPPPLQQSSSQTAKSSLSLPVPVATTSASGIVGNATTSKRKAERRQIKIDALEALPSDADEDGPAKKPKVEKSESSSGRSGLTGLMGLLPAPKERPPPDLKADLSHASNNMGLSEGSIGRLEVQQNGLEGKKVKGNNDFRSMLGLKPSSLASKPKSAPNTELESKEPVVSRTTSEPPAARPADEVKSDFFATDTSEAEKSKSSSRTGFSISSAPRIEDDPIDTLPIVESALSEEDQYKGWQQGPDGSWFPVTPEAHAAYNDYLASQGSQRQQHSINDRPADIQFDEAHIVYNVDANASRQAWLSRPSTEVDASSSGLDRKYAMAAASLATPDQGIPLVDQEEEVKKMDKKTNSRARRKGQLSALIAQADENREKLEERWSRGKDGRHAAKEKYGF